MRDRARQLRRTMTPAESRLWAALRNNQLDGFHFRRQQVIDGYIADFYCHAAALVVETDGAVHGQQPDYDAERDDLLKRRGLLILRLRNQAVLENLDAVLDQIRQLCRARTT
jgi:very-short-patch-repair endonuclease